MLQPGGPRDPLPIGIPAPSPRAPLLFAGIASQVDHQRPRRCLGLSFRRHPSQDVTQRLGAPSPSSTKSELPGAVPLGLTCRKGTSRASEAQPRAPHLSRQQRAPHLSHGQACLSCHRLASRRSPFQDLCCDWFRKGEPVPRAHLLREGGGVTRPPLQGRTRSLRPSGYGIAT